MNKFNLIQIIPSMNSGGIEQGTLDLANYIAEKKIKNHIISNGGRMLPYLNKKYVEHNTLSVHSKNFLKMPFVASQINKIIEKNKINILHVRSRAPAWLIPFINKTNIKTVSTFHNIYGHNNFFKKMYNNALARTDYILAISDYVAEEISKIYKINSEKITTINRGIDSDFFNPDIIDEKNLLSFLNKYKIPSDKKIILYPGRLTEWKGQLQFLKIVEKINNKSFEYYFVGDDKNKNYSKKLEKEIYKRNLNRNCRILGHLKSDELKIMYKCCDLVISMPLKPEGFGRIVSESLSMKKIILAHNVGGVKNQLQQINDLYKINSTDQDEIIKKIKFILTSPYDKFEKIKIESRNHILKNFSKKIMLDKYINFYSKIIY